MHEIRKTSRQPLLSLALTIVLVLATLSSCSMRPALDKIYTSRSGGAISPNPGGQANHGAGADADAIKTRGDWFCPTGSCRFRSVSNGQPFRSFAPQACPFCGTKLEK